MCAHVCACVRVCAHVHVCGVCACVHMCVRMCVYACVCMCVVCVCVYVCMCIVVTACYNDLINLNTQAPKIIMLQEGHVQCLKLPTTRNISHIWPYMEMFTLAISISAAAPLLNWC